MTFDLESLSRRELQHLAKELSLCRGNAKSDLILQHAQALAAKADGAEQIRVALSSLAGGETVTEATPAKSPVAGKKATPTKPAPIIVADKKMPEATKTTPKKSPKTVAKSTPTSTPVQTPTADAKSKKSPAEKNATKKSPVQKTPEQTKASPVAAKKTPEQTKPSPVTKKTPEKTKASPVSKKTPEQTKASPKAKKTPEQTKASPVAAKKTPEQARPAAKKPTPSKASPSAKASPRIVDNAKNKKPAKKATRDVGTLVSSTDDLSFIGDGSRVRCSTTGHEMKADYDVITAHIAGKRYQRARGQKASFSSYAPMFVPHPDENLTNMLWCNVTETAIPRDIERVKAHVKGSRYQKELPIWKKAEAAKAEEAKAAAAKKAQAIIKKRKREGEEPTESSSDDAAVSTEKNQTGEKPNKKRKRSRRSRK